MWLANPFAHGHRREAMRRRLRALAATPSGTDGGTTVGDGVREPPAALSRQLHVTPLRRPQRKGAGVTPTPATLERGSNGGLEQAETTDGRDAPRLPQVSHSTDAAGCPPFGGTSRYRAGFAARVLTGRHAWSNAGLTEAVRGRWPSSGRRFRATRLKAEETAPRNELSRRTRWVGPPAPERGGRAGCSSRSIRHGLV